jgi:hypothetical protein
MDLSDGALLLGGDGRYFNDLVSVCVCACACTLRVAFGVKSAYLYCKTTQSSHALSHHRLLRVCHSRVEYACMFHGHTAEFTRTVTSSTAILPVCCSILYGVLGVVQTYVFFNRIYTHSYIYCKG